MSASRTIIPPSNSNGSSPKKPTSQEKIEANRRNARRSTGPKTVNGKRAVSRNALKHGLLAREVVISGGDGAENAEEFQVLLERLWVHYQPDGIVEEMLVETTAASWWRLARVLRAETGEIRKRLDSVDLDYHLNLTDKMNRSLFSLHSFDDGRLYNPENEADRKISSEERILKVQGFQSDLRGNEMGVSYLREIWAGAKSEILEQGRISERRREVLLANCGLCDYAFVMAILNAATNPVEQNSKEVGGAQSCHAQRAALSLIDHQLQILEMTNQLATRKQTLGERAERQSLCLPSERAADKLLRYETHLERQLYRAMDQLERLQRRRAGESVPPPLSVNLARRM